MKKTNTTALLLCMCITAFLLISCPSAGPGIIAEDLAALPEDSGGDHISFALGTTDSPYGFYRYLPGGYDSSLQSYPLLVFLHGSGERGNSDTDPADLDRVLKHGPPKLIKQEEWDPPYPMIVISLQCPTGSSWDPAKIHAVIEYMIEEYRINSSRIYMTGLSMGGYGTFGYIGRYGDNSYAAAVVPVCGAGNTSQAAKFLNTPLWAFHGEEDRTVYPSGSINMVEAINMEQPQVKAKLTMYPGVGHDSWTRTYNGSGMGTENDDYDPFDESIYEWMFRYSK